MQIAVQQPDLRAFIVLPRLPEGCLSFIVPDDRAEPHLHAGDIAIVDPDDREPDHGDLFLIQFNGGRQQVVEIRRHPRLAGFWSPHWGMTIQTLDGRHMKVVGWSDGPYSTDHMREKLIGRVVGILQPAFDGPMRELA